MHKEKIVDTLKIVYDKYHSLGIEAIYLWGSVVSDEYNPALSDVDVVAILKDDHSVDKESIRRELKTIAPEINMFGFNCVIIKELKDGVSINNRLTYVIHPRMLLADMKYWELVEGRNFTVTDFTDVPPTADELIVLQLMKIKRDNWVNSSNVEDNFIVYYLKGLTRLVYYKQWARNVVQPFTYKGVSKYANSSEKEIIKIFNQVKESDYDRVEFLKYENIMDDFVSKLIKEYGN